MKRWWTVSDHWGRRTQQIGVDADDKILISHVIHLEPLRCDCVWNRRIWVCSTAEWAQWKPVAGRSTRDTENGWSLTHSFNRLIRINHFHMHDAPYADKWKYFSFVLHILTNISLTLHNALSTQCFHSDKQPTAEHSTNRNRFHNENCTEIVEQWFPRNESIPPSFH